MSLTAKEILAIPVDKPGWLFSRVPSQRVTQHRELRSTHHPDRGGDAAVFAHVQVLYEAAEKMNPTEWEERNQLHIKSLGTNNLFVHNFTSSKAFELGRVYDGRDHMIYAVRKEFKDLFDNGVRVLKSIQFPDEKSKKENARFFPTVLMTLESEVSYLLVLKKPEECYSLRGVLEKFGGIIPPEHVAWMVSAAFNIAASLTYLNKITHSDISPDTLFVSPKNHIGVLMGGWWYAAPNGTKLLATSQRSHGNNVPVEIGGHVVHTELMRLLVRELSGDIKGSKLIGNKVLPAPLRVWSMGVGGKEVLPDFIEYTQAILKKAFGKRKFVELEYP